MVELEDVKTLLGITDDTKDDLIQFALYDAAEIIRSYCNISVVPDDLDSTLTRMAIEIFRSEQLGTEKPTGSVMSVHEGDTQITYGAQYDNAYKESLLKNHAKILNRFRRVVFR